MLRIIPTKHFIERLGERYFDLSAIAKLHMEIAKNPKARIFEVTTGNATIVAVREKPDLIKLITGWVGNRKKQKMEEMQQ
ncbi:hypothetical protein [Nitrosophilus labii]|uniref:hypothetical protein n=1 Tax=Nitrosophilus labii TaxID=2706014 RepID=UPI001656EE87|nr:hypothetical protein [Nitrosophilus labii]